jgi:DNA modification methylase
MSWAILQADARAIPLQSESVQCVVTSPPYWGLRDYNCNGQIGLEKTPEEYVSSLVAVFREVWRVLRKDGVVFLNLGDSYGARGGDTHTGFNERYFNKKFATDKQGTPSKWGNQQIITGLKPKDLCGIPWRIAFALQADGWWLRSDIIWSKPNPMPESVTDRPTRAHEYIFLLAKSERYYFDQDAVREERGNEMSWEEYNQRTAPGATWESGGLTRYAGANKHDGGHSHPNGRNIRSVWNIATQPFSGWTKTVRWDRGAGGVASGDSVRIASLDCLKHGDRFALVASAFCDKHAVDLLIDNFGKRSYLFRRPQPGFSPIGQRLEHLIELCNSGCLSQKCVLSASDRSSESHKKAHALLTNPSCIVCDKIPLHIAGKIKELFETDSVVRKLLNSIAPDDLACHPLVQIPSRSEDISSCCCAYYTSKSEETSHFATFPEELAERCIKAGSKPGDVVLDPFAGAGTTPLVADKLGRKGIGTDLKPEYCQMGHTRCFNDAPLLSLPENFLV